MGFGVSVGPLRHYEVNSVQVQPLTQSGLYIVECSITAFIHNGPPGYPRERDRLCDVTLTVQAEDAHRWVEGVLDELVAHDPHAMPTDRQAMMRAVSRMLPKHLARLLLREAMRRQGPLRQKLRRSLKREHAVLWKKPMAAPPDWDAFYKAHNSSIRNRYALAVIKDLMRDLGKYLPARMRPPPRPPPHSYVDLKPPPLRRFGQTVVDRSDCIKPSPAPPSE